MTETRCVFFGCSETHSSKVGDCELHAASAPPPPLNLFMVYTEYVLPSAADEEFDELCFDFGIELDEVVSTSLALIVHSKIAHCKSETWTYT